jgi:two-component system, LytTR family, sensor histidine kinase AlgZ
VTIVVRNPLDPEQAEREGNRLALANIRERLGLMYGERALLKSRRFDSEYIVTLRFPLRERPASATSPESGVGTSAAASAAWPR